MARFTYGTGDISYSTFPSWSNAIASNPAATNISASSAFSDYHPSQSFSGSNIQVTSLTGSSVFYGSIVSGPGGNVEITAPYTAGSSNNITVKNLNITATSITCVATPSYPSTFDSWRTGASGSGASISTNATLTITDGAGADHETYFAYFT